MLAGGVALLGSAEERVDGLYSAMFLDSASDEGFAKFLKQNDVSCDDVKGHYSFSIFNMTNAEEYLAGAKPVVRELSPIVYCKLVKEVQADEGRINDGILHYRTREEVAIISQGVPMNATVVIPNPNYAGAVALGVEGRLGGLKAFGGGYPAFMTMKVNEFLGYQGAAMEPFEPYLVKSRFSMNTLKEGWGSWQSIRVDTPGAPPADAAPANTLPGFWNVEGYKNSSYHCGFDKDCRSQASFTDKSDIGGCTPDAFCEPAYVGGYSGRYLPTGRFFDLLPRELPYDPDAWAKEGSDVSLWSSDLQKPVLLRNGGEKNLGELRVHRWEAVGPAGRFENCNATAPVDDTCPLPADATGMMAYVGCLTSKCQDASDLVMGQLGATCAASFLGGATCTTALPAPYGAMGMKFGMLCAARCCALPGGAPTLAPVDSKGYDCDSPFEAVWVGGAASMTKEVPVYGSSPFFQKLLHDAENGPNGPAWQPQDRVDFIKCQGCAEPEDRADELMTSVLSLKETGWVLQFNQALQTNLRMAYPTQLSLYPNATECLLPISFTRHYSILAEKDSARVQLLVAVVGLSGEAFPTSIILGLLFLIMPCFCVRDAMLSKAKASSREISERV